MMISSSSKIPFLFFFFFFNDTATTEIYTLSLHDALPIFPYIRFIGTRWWSGDVYEHIEDVFGHDEEPREYLLKAKLSNGQMATRKVYRVGDIAVFRVAA